MAFTSVGRNQCWDKLYNSPEAPDTQTYRDYCQIPIVKLRADQGGLLVDKLRI